MRDTPNGRAWVEALRSGRYRQGRGSLKNHLGDYCCLGVAKEAVLGEDCGSRLTLAERDWEALGITAEEELSCVDMNDGSHRDFNFIADVLERAMNDGVSVNAAHKTTDYRRKDEP